jgi:hypothetical protein
VGSQERGPSDRGPGAAARTRRGPRWKGIGQDVDFVEAGLGVEDVLGGAPCAGLQPNLAQLLDIEAAPLTARRQSRAAAARVLVDQDMGDPPRPMLSRVIPRYEDFFVVLIAVPRT